MQQLLGKNIILGISASIAAYKSLDLIRLLRKQGAVVRAIPTHKALDFVTQLSIDTLTSPLTPLHQVERGIKHIEQAYEADLLLIAPATADLIAKMAHGFADELLLQTYLSYKGPVLVAPAMETHMWEHPATQANIEILKKRGVQIINPESGELASGRSGIGRLAELETILEHVLMAFSPQDFKGQKVLLTAGPTVEELDPVRYLSNYSSGKMGVALARALMHRGAEVSLIHGPLQVRIPSNIKSYPIKTAQQMLGLALELSPKSNLAILCAAVADYRPAEREKQKIKKNSSQNYSLALIENPDILKTLGQQSSRPFLVGFAAESLDLDRHAQQKILSKNCDLICANLVGSDDSGFGSDMNQISIFNRNGFVCALEKQDKNMIADRILDVILMEKNTCLNNSDFQKNF
ncbi:MAG: bifunctional phosphopantothenoylcysteine decarboxylase/phosphopantothenate--cysteine ligase CoaBC [Myxococcaceae bacterium]